MLAQNSTFKKLNHGIQSHHFMANRWGNSGMFPHRFQTMETMRDYFSWAPKSLKMVTVAMKLKDTCSLEEKL